MVSGISMVDGNQKPCEACVLGKHQRKKFVVGEAWRATNSLILIYADICGPMQTPSLNESKYLLIFVDDFTIMTGV